MKKQKKKLFVVGDIHSFYDEFKTALDKTEYDADNPNHLLISLGDMFDRGPKSQEVLDFFNGINNKILIRGNHEDLLLDCLHRGFPYSHDITNGTVRTIMNLGNVRPKSDNYYIPDNPQDFSIGVHIAYVKVIDLINSMLNFYETEKYIFVHSWIPVAYVSAPKIVLGRPTYIYKEDWKTAHMSQWDSARWFNPFELAMRDMNQTGKTIVFGHWHTSWWRTHFGGEVHEFGPNANLDIIEIPDKKCIGIDGCTVSSGQVNILCLEDFLLPEEKYE